MNIGLFDLYTNGHHLPYAARLKNAIERNPRYNVNFITVTESDRCSRLFDQDDLEYLDERNSDTVEDRNQDFDELSDDLIDSFFSSNLITNLDLVHFLFADNILGPLYRHVSGQSNTRLVAELNGVFFERKMVLRSRYFHKIIMSVLTSPGASVMDIMIPKNPPFEQQWRDLHLYRCLSDRKFNSIVVHSDEAQGYVRQFYSSHSVPLTKVPYPAPEKFGREIPQGVARNRLGFPSDTRILLFFGTLRKQKGIHQLLRVLREYNGPTFTMCLAGPPHSVTKREIMSIKKESKLDILTELSFIEQPELYLRASDAVILPYTRTFGRECTSQTLEEATSSMRPVIVPDFGAVGRITKQWKLGTTYVQGSDKSLKDTLATFATDGVSFSHEKMEEYNRSHTYSEAADLLTSIYDRTID